MIAPAISFALSYSTSPTSSYPFSVSASTRLIPTSMTVAPSGIILPSMISGMPAAATTISAARVRSARFSVRE